MMQHVAASKTNIASSGVNAGADAGERQEKGREFGAIFQQQEQKSEPTRTESTEKAALQSQEKPQSTKKTSDEVKGAQQTKTAQSSSKEVDEGNKTKDEHGHHCEECEAHEKGAKETDTARNSDDKKESGSNQSKEESDVDLLALLKGIKESDIKHQKPIEGHIDPEKPISDERIPIVSPVVESIAATSDGDVKATESKILAATKADLASGEKKIAPELQTEVDKIAQELKLTPEQKLQLEKMLQQAGQQGANSIKLDKTDVKLAALLVATDGNKAVTEQSLKTADKDLNVLLNMSDKQVEKVLSQLSAALTGAKGQQGTSGKEQNFLASLKAGLAEIKQQLQQGHEPGISLKDLLQQAAAESTDFKGEGLVKGEQFKQVIQKTMLVADAVVREQTQNSTPAGTADRQLVAETQQVRTETMRHNVQNLTQAQLDRPVNINRPEGHQQLVDKVRMMVNSKNLNADIRLDPPDLGSMTIKISMQGEQASVSFVVQSQQAQQTLEQSSPRLREMLAERGIELGQSSVQQDSAGNQANKDGEQGLAGNGQSDQQADGESAQEVTTRVVNGTLGGIDYFA